MAARGSPTRHVFSTSTRADPEQQLRRLLEVATFTLATGDADAHGKNLAFIHDDDPSR